MTTPDSTVHPADEQAWLQQALAAPEPRLRWRVWQYQEAAIVVGRAQGLALAGTGLPVLKRPTGGGAVLVGPWMVGVSVVMSPTCPLLGPGVTAAYRWMGLAHARWLRGFGLDARVCRGPGTPAPAGLDWACFAGLSPWEVTVGGRKITGLAQARRGGTVVLSAGTLVTATPWRQLCAAVGREGQAPLLAARTTDGEALLCGTVDVAGWARALQQELSRWLAPSQRGRRVVANDVQPISWTT